MLYEIFDHMHLSSDEAVREMLPLVSEQRRQQALRYQHTFGQFCCLKSYLMLLELLAAVYPELDKAKPEFGYTEKGKPFLLDRPDIHFSISHTKNAILVAIADAPIGVDIEAFRSPSAALIARTMNPTEQAAIAASAATAATAATLEPPGTASGLLEPPGTAYGPGTPSGLLEPSGTVYGPETPSGLLKPPGTASGLLEPYGTASGPGTPSGLLEPPGTPEALFSAIWTRKEAVLKLRGTGIEGDLREVLSGSETILTRIFPLKGYAFSIAQQAISPFESFPC